MQSIALICDIEDHRVGLKPPPCVGAVSARCKFLLDYEEEDDEDSGKKKSKKKKRWRLRWPDDFRDEVL
ncbi:MAG: hypothetical protein ABGZ35_06490, partial [Planctomycetaceae bacterium]